jgi:hypothetical protein
MTRSSMRSRRAIPVVVLLLGAAGSCANPRLDRLALPPKISAEAEDDTLSGAPAHLGGPEDLTGPPQVVKIRATPTLTKRIELMTEGEIIDYFKQLQYDTDVATTETVDARCHHSGGGPCGTGDSAHVFIQPEVGMYWWKHTKIPKEGMVVGRIINYSPVGDDEYTFHFPGHQRTWWVVDSVPGGLRSRYFVRTHESGPPIRFVTSVFYPFLDCNHGAPKNKEAKAKFKDCASSMLNPSTTPGDRVERGAIKPPEVSGVANFAGVPGAVPLPVRPTVIQLRATWVTCDVGCCATS